MRRWPKSAPAFGVRGACSRFLCCGVERKRQQAGRTPNASRVLKPQLKVVVYSYLVGLEVVDGLHLRGRRRPFEPRR